MWLLDASATREPHRISVQHCSAACLTCTDHVAVQVRYALLQEGTSMVQVQLRQSLVQWPYLTDMSLISAIVSVFVPTWAVPPGFT
jgi:hypothetical protein